MKIKYSVVLVITFAVFTARAQKRTETLQIELPEQKIPGCLYSSVKLIDKRIDTTTYGIIQQGAFNRKVKVITEVPLDQQLTAVVNALIDNTAKNGELVLLLRQFSLAETTGALSEKGYCYLRVILFGSVNGLYQKLATVDTVITIGGLDVTKALLRQGSTVMTGLLTSAITKAPAEAVSYTFDNLVAMDSIEKSVLPVYNTTVFKTGAYKTFSSFASQQPEDEDLLMEFWKKR
ncbi:MAG: hypothetical protein WDO16_08595 [Bacteroidota bacterium]